MRVSPHLRSLGGQCCDLCHCLTTRTSDQVLTVLVGGASSLTGLTGTQDLGGVVACGTVPQGGAVSVQKPVGQEFGSELAGTSQPGGGTNR